MRLSLRAKVSHKDSNHERFRSGSIVRPSVLTVRDTTLISEYSSESLQIRVPNLPPCQT